MSVWWRGRDETGWGGGPENVFVRKGKEREKGRKAVGRGRRGKGREINVLLSGRVA